MSLVEERDSWRQMFEEGHKLDHHYMSQYRKYRDSELWRMSSAVEQLCEYILYLESKIEELP